MVIDYQRVKTLVKDISWKILLDNFVLFNLFSEKFFLTYLDVFFRLLHILSLLLNLHLNLLDSLILFEWIFNNIWHHQNNLGSFASTKLTRSLTAWTTSPPYKPLLIPPLPQPNLTSSSKSSYSMDTILWVKSSRLHNFLITKGHRKRNESHFRNRFITSWNDLLQALESWFAPSFYDHPNGVLFKLSQHGSINDYMTEFKRLANRIIGLPPSFLLSCFIFGLLPNLRCEV